MAATWRQVFEKLMHHTQVADMTIAQQISTGAIMLPAAASMSVRTLPPAVAHIVRHVQHSGVQTTSGLQKHRTRAGLA